MKIKNLEAGLRKTLIAAFRSEGLSEAAADEKASKHLAAAETHFNEKLVESKKVVNVTRSHASTVEKLRSLRALRGKKIATLADSPRAVSAALRSVAVWTKSL